MVSLSRSHYIEDADTLDSNKVSNDNADTSSAVVQLAEEIDDVFLRHGVSPPAGSG